jgi:hypothetical protein
MMLAVAGGGIVLATVPSTAVAQKKLEVRKEVREKVTAAQDDLKKGATADAIKHLKEAKAIGGLKPDEEYAVNELLIYAANSSRDYRLLADTIEERLATGRVSGADKVQKLNVLANSYYSANDLRKAADATQRLIAARGTATGDDLTLLGTIQFQLKDYRSAAATLERAVGASGGKSAKAQGQLLEMLNRSYFETGDQVKRLQTLGRLMSVAPSVGAFEQVASVIEREAGGDSAILVNLYRLGAKKGVLGKAHYAKYADAALDVSSPGEAAAALEKGMGTGAIKKDDRSSRLLADAKKQVGDLQKLLPQQEKEAKALASGEGDVRLATAYFTLKDYARAAEAAKRGLGKGRVKRADDANMLLGVSLVEAKKGGEAKAAFQAAAAANPKMKSVADLWSAVG